MSVATGRLAGRLALVTGGAGAGIGSATCRRLAAEGAEVVVTDRHAGRIEQLLGVLRADGCIAHGHVLDVDDEGAVDTVLDDVVDRCGRPVDILVNSAAVNVVAAMEHTDSADWHRILGTDLVAPWYVTRAVLPGMAARGGGAVVNVCSLVAYLGEPDQMAYAAAKAALGALTRSVALRGGPDGIRCNAVSPGIIDSPFVAKHGDALAGMVRRTPLRRTGRAAEVASVIAFLASDDASFVTGETIAVGGGVYLRA